MRAQDLRANGPRSRRLRSYVWPGSRCRSPIGLGPLLPRMGPPFQNYGTVTGLAHGPGGWAGMPHAGNEPHARALHIYNYVCITVALNALCELDTSILCYNSSVIL